MRRKPEYKPLLFTTTVRNPTRVKGLLKILSSFNGQILTNELAKKIMGELIRHGLYRPMIRIATVKKKWTDTKTGDFSNILLSDSEVRNMLKKNPQNHKEAGFAKGWPSRFVTIFDFAKELGFVYFWQNENIKFSPIGLKLANSIEIKTDKKYILISNPHPEFEQQAFLHALAKSQRNNPFLKVLNENVPLILLLQVIQKLNSDKKFNGAGISKLELPIVIFWKNNNAEELYQLIKLIRKGHSYTPSWEVIVETCIEKIMTGSFKKFSPKSIMSEYPDEFIRKMRLTGLISLRGGGRFIDINKNEQDKVDYVLKEYSKYKKYATKREYFDYMAKVDKKLISFTPKTIDVETNNKYLSNWVQHYSFSDIKKELTFLSSRKISGDGILKYLPHPVRLEFLVSIAIKHKFPNIKVVPNYPCDDEGIPTSTAGGMGNQGDIECLENKNGILVEVTMSEGRSQTVMEIWPITRHLEKFNQKTEVSKSMCYFIAPSIFKDSKRQIKFVKQEYNLSIYPETIDGFLNYIDTKTLLYRND
jgi:hypothetical protein